ncbi:hypothetical protein M2283_009896 [Streptomyces pseudovenezuelae]|uniref:Uncharacterized protein n=1 Tax=Streptomyces pseudovenezuelae TaxID=67350 RepID=A0ABT6M1V3_9ACTN|nr:hypothetical protein [Streptomyces pseudovenezuelae]
MPVVAAVLERFRSARHSTLFTFPHILREQNAAFIRFAPQSRGS